MLLLVALLVAAVWYSVARARPSDVVSGTIEADETHVGSKLGGRVVAVHAQEGASLKKSTSIVDFDDAEIKARRDAAAAAVASAEAQVAEWEHGPLPREIEQARQSWESAKASADLARKNLVRTKELFESKVASTEDLDRDTKRLDALEAQSSAAEQQYNRLKEGTRAEKLDQARSELKQLKARLMEIETLVAESRVVAPADSTLEILHVKVGDIIAPNRPVATLLLEGNLWVRVYVREDWLGHISLGDEPELRTDAFPEKVFQGKVVHVARRAEFTPRNVQTDEERGRQLFAVKIQFAEADPRLRAGMTAKVEFPKVRTRNR